MKELWTSVSETLYVMYTAILLLYGASANER